MKLPRSFSILSLLLLTTILALSLTVYFDRIAIHQANLENKQLNESIGAFEIKDQSQIHVRSLRKTHKMCWEFRIYVPAGESCTFNFGDGIVSKGTTHPLPLRTRTIEGSGEQQIVSFQIRRVGSGKEWGVNDIGGSGQAVCTDPDRFHWLSQVEEIQRLGDGPLGSRHGPVQLIDTEKESVVWMQSENEYHAFDSNSGARPRVFMAWVEAIKGETQGK